MFPLSVSITLYRIVSVCFAGNHQERNNDYQCFASTAILHPISNRLHHRSVMTIRQFKINHDNYTTNISIKKKTLEECVSQEALIRKIFHNPSIIGATINYSNGHIVRIDLEE